MAELVYLENVKHDPDSVVTVGTFDGVHKGHRILMETVIERAEDLQARSVIVTFDPHPREIIDPGEQGIKLLTTLEERCEILADLGIDLMVVIPFDRDFSLMDSETFVQKIIYEKIGVSEFVIGYDHHFGRNREGTIETVRALGKNLGFTTRVVSRQEVEEHVVSSTAIRNAISEEGNMKLAAELLGRSYMLNGTVIHGDKRGKEIGFPTANIKPDRPNKILPRNGVYAVRVRVDGQWYGGMMNIGTRPTFEKESDVTLEVHLFDFTSEIYGKSLQVRFVQRIRDEKKFPGPNELIGQLERDRSEALSCLKKQ